MHWRYLDILSSLLLTLGYLSHCTALLPSAEPTSAAFGPRHYGHHHDGQDWRLYGKSLNKQAELRRKMELAKKQKSGGDNNATNESSKEGGGKSHDAAKLSADEIKQRNDRLRFEELLKKSSSTVLNDYSSDGYLNAKQEEAEISAQRSGIDRIFEGDPAPVDCFQDLHTVQTQNKLGKKGTERLLPWMHFSEKDYLICLCDPRAQSPELRQSVKNILAELPRDLQEALIVINADSPAENRRWMKRNEISENRIRVFSDESKEWMRSFTALGEKRWSMTMFVLANGRCQKIAREVDEYAVARVIQNAVESYKSEKRL